MINSIMQFEINKNNHNTLIQQKTEDLFTAFHLSTQIKKLTL